MFGRRLADTPRSTSRCSIAEKVIGGNNDDGCHRRRHHHHPPSPTSSSPSSSSFAGVFTDTRERGEEAKKRKEKKAPLRGTINSYAKHVRADTHTRPPRWNAPYARSPPSLHPVPRNIRLPIAAAADINTCSSPAGPGHLISKNSPIDFHESGEPPRAQDDGETPARARTTASTLPAYF